MRKRNSRKPKPRNAASSHPAGKIVGDPNRTFGQQVVEPEKKSLIDVGPVRPRSDESSPAVEYEPPFEVQEMMDLLDESIIMSKEPRKKPVMEEPLDEDK